MKDPTPFDTVGDESVEARIVAWVLGETSAFEAAELERLCEERPELLVFRRRMRALHGLLTEAEAAQMRGPVGLNLGALTPPEIAMSIVAEMTAMRRGTDLSQALSNWEGSKTVCGLA